MFKRSWWVWPQKCSSLQLVGQKLKVWNPYTLSLCILSLHGDVQFVIVENACEMVQFIHMAHIVDYIVCWVVAS
jgi:hypothetical protein